jgi:hypothetical protein
VGGQKGLILYKYIMKRIRKTENCPSDYLTSWSPRLILESEEHRSNYAIF